MPYKMALKKLKVVGAEERKAEQERPPLPCAGPLAGTVRATQLHRGRNRPPVLGLGTAMFRTAAAESISCSSRRYSASPASDFAALRWRSCIISDALLLDTLGWGSLSRKTGLGLDTSAKLVVALRAREASLVALAHLQAAQLR